MAYWPFFRNFSLVPMHAIMRLLPLRGRLQSLRILIVDTDPRSLSVLRDVNLAVGIDFGGVHLVQVAGGLTVVGNAVVYACRLSGGPPGTILLNQPAYEEISAAYGGLCLITETSIEITNTKVE